MENCRVLAGFKESNSEKLLARAVTLLAPKAESLCIDIGSGEMHVLEYVYQRAQCKCIGIESDPSLVAFSRKKISSLGLCGVEVLEDDAELFDFSRIVEGSMYCKCLLGCLPFFYRGG